MAAILQITFSNSFSRMKIVLEDIFQRFTTQVFCIDSNSRILYCQNHFSRWIFIDRVMMLTNLTGTHIHRHQTFTNYKPYRTTNNILHIYVYIVCLSPCTVSNVGMFNGIVFIPNCISLDWMWNHFRINWKSLQYFFFSGISTKWIHI